MNIKHLLLFAGLAAGLTSCDHLLEFEPGDVILAEDAIQDAEDLQRLLEARADPNMTVGEGSISPMENIMTFAREIHVPIRFHKGPMFPFAVRTPRVLSTYLYSVEQMRNLLLDYEAKNSRALRERWRIRQAADANDPIWLANFHHDPR